VAFGERAERWFKAKAHLKPSTRHDYRALLDHQVLPAFREAALASIDTLAVREWVAGLVAGGLSAKRAGKALQVLSQVLTSAVEGGRLAVNRAAGVKPPKGQRNEMHFLDADQVEALADAIDPRYRPLVLFAAYTACAPANRSRSGSAGWTCWPALPAWSRRPYEPGSLVFTAPMGGPLDRAGFVRTCFKPAIRAANEALAKLPRTSARGRCPRACACTTCGTRAPRC
jgi:hypothetical protein